MKNNVHYERNPKQRLEKKKLRKSISKTVKDVGNNSQLENYSASLLSSLILGKLVIYLISIPQILLL